MLEKFNVSGMTCVNCSSGIEKFLSKQKGVNSVSVSLLTKQMTVDFNPDEISAQIIIDLVKRLGYEASLTSEEKQTNRSDANKLKIRFVFSVMLLIPLMYLCMGKMLGLPIFQDDKINFLVQGVLALCIIILNKKYFINGTKAILNKSPNMDTLVALGSAAAFVYSVTITVLLFLGKNEIRHAFFDSSAMVVTLVTLGKWLEELAKIKTGDAVESLGKLMPQTVTVLVDGQEKIVQTKTLKIGDLLLIRAGEYVAVDGIVIEGNANVDKSAITGESMPENVTIGNNLISGSILNDGYVILRAQSVGEQTQFSKIIEAIKQASTSKAPIQKMADKVSKYFVPTVSIIAIITFIIWLVTTSDLYLAFNFGISVLVVSCPCALGLATPVAIMTATGNGAKDGILFKSASVLEKVCKIDCVLLDKTATITVGKPKVTTFELFADTKDSEVKKIAYALESKSSHPLAQSIVEFCDRSAMEVQNYKNVLGKGVSGEIYGITYYIGNHGFMPEYLNVQNVDEKYEGQTVIYFASDIEFIGVFAISDYPKEDSKIAINDLQNDHIKTVMITGDTESVAKSIANQVGIKEFVAQVLPQDKFEIVNQYKQKGYTVAMVGDGINDSPALKSADIGIAMGTGTDIAIDSSDLVIANGSLSGVKKAISLSKRTLNVIKQNLFWAFFYNVIGIPIAGGALVFLGVSLTPVIASAMMSCSSLIVVTNALRLSKRKQKVSKNNIVQNADKKTMIAIEGMMCNHCVEKVKKALTSIQGVGYVNVSLQKKSATLEHNKSVTENIIINAIENVGFNVSEIKQK